MKEIAPPVLLFLVGVFLSELLQWSKWIVAHPGQKWRGYWSLGVPHLMGNAIVIVGTGVLWWAGLLDKAIDWLIPKAVAGEWANVGIPFTPQVGWAVGAGSDLFGDMIVYLFRAALGRMFPSLNSTSFAAPLPAPPPKGD